MCWAFGIRSISCAEYVRVPCVMGNMLVVHLADCMDSSRVETDEGVG